MEAQHIIQLKNPSLFLFPKSSFSTTVKSPSRLSRRFRHVLLASHPSAAAPKREKDAKKRIVITGMGLVSVFGNDVDTYYDRLLAGESGISLIDKFDASIFPTRFGGQIRGFKSNGYIDAKSDSRLDDCQRYCLVAGKKALEDAGIGSHELLKIDKERAGVLVGSGGGGVTVFSDAVKCLIERGHKKITPFFAPYSLTSIASAVLAMHVGFMGPNYNISAACATANACFCAAANHIRLGNADMMIAGGVDAPLIPLELGGFVACRALSRRNHDPQTASRPWDKERDGFVLSEGAGVLVTSPSMLDELIISKCPSLDIWLTIPTKFRHCSKNLNHVFVCSRKPNELNLLSKKAQRSFQIV